jgi:repressor of nif and glnA expression
VFRADSDKIESIEGIKRRVREGVSRLRGLDIGDTVAVEILAQLVESKMTVTEMVERVYGLNISDEGYHSCYSRIRRELKILESKGLVSRKLFGKEKPYRLTALAITNLARIGGEEKQLGLFSRIDVGVYLATFGSSIIIVVIALGWFQLSELGVLGLFGIFCFFLGAAVFGSLRAIRRVF